MKPHATILCVLSSAALLACSQLAAPPGLTPLQVPLQLPPQAALPPRAEAAPSSLNQPGEPQLLALLAPSRAYLGAGPELVEISKNVYELRDRPAPGALTTTAGATPATPATPATAATALATPASVAAAPLSLWTSAITQAEALIKASDPVYRTTTGSARVEISNGVGIRFLARRTAERLAPMGVRTARLTNQLPYRQASTEIQFQAGQQEAAHALANLLPLPVKTVASNALLKSVQLRLVLGHDQASRSVAAWLDGQAPAHATRPAEPAADAAVSSAARPWVVS